MNFAHLFPTLNSIRTLSPFDETSIHPSSPLGWNVTFKVAERVSPLAFNLPRRIDEYLLLNNRSFRQNERYVLSPIWNKRSPEVKESRGEAATPSRALGDRERMWKKREGLEGESRAESGGMGAR